MSQEFLNILFVKRTWVAKLTIFRFGKLEKLIVSIANMTVLYVYPACLISRRNSSSSFMPALTFIQLP